MTPPTCMHVQSGCRRLGDGSGTGTSVPSHPSRGGLSRPTKRYDLPATVLGLQTSRLPVPLHPPPCQLTRSLRPFSQVPPEPRRPARRPRKPGSGPLRPRVAPTHRDVHAAVRGPSSACAARPQTVSGLAVTSTAKPPGSVPSLGKGCLLLEEQHCGPYAHPVSRDQRNLFQSPCDPPSP